MKNKPDTTPEATLEHYVEFHDFAPVGCFTLARDGIISQINIAGAALIGLDRSKLVGRQFTKFVSAEYQPALDVFLAQVFERKSKQECVTVLQQRATSPKLFVQINAITNKSGHDCFMVVIDITERVRLEKALREKDYLLSESQRFAHIGSWSMAVNKNNIRWTDETYRIYGVTPDTFVPTTGNLISLIHPKDQAAMQEWIRACVAGEHPEDLKFRAVRPDGSVRSLRGQGDLQCAPDGTPLLIIGTVQDITGYKLIYEKIRQDEMRYRKLFQSAGDYALLMEMDESVGPVIVDANDAAFERHGYKRDEMIGKPITLVDKKIPLDRMGEVARQLELDKPLQFETEHTCKDGSIFTVEVTLRLIEYEGRKLFFSIERDIAKRKHVEMVRE